MKEVYLMRNQTLEEVLESNPTLRMRDMPGVINGLQMQGANTSVTPKMTAQEALRLLRINDPSLLNKTVDKLLIPRTGKGRMHECKTMAMWVSLVLMTVGYAGVNMYNGIIHGNLIPWEEIIFTIIGPMILVFHDRGLTFRENRDMLSAIAGSAPAMTIFDAMSKRIINGPANTKHEHSTKSTKTKTETTATEDY